MKKRITNTSATRFDDAWALMRVSSNNQKDNNSFENQKMHIIEFAANRGLKLVHIQQIVESAKSNNDRAKYKEFLKSVLKRGVGNIIFYSQDRESRNMADSEENERLIREGRVRVHYALERKTFDENTPDSEFLNRDFSSAMNKNYSRELGTKVKKGMLIKAQSGWSPACTPPLGFIHQKLKTDKGFEKNRGTILVPDSNLSVVRMVQKEFELRANVPPPSLVSIRDQLMNTGVIPSHLIKRYSIAALERRLKNIFYDQRFIWAGDEYQGKHARIISHAIFNKAQETFGLRNPYSGKGEGYFKNGWMKCSKDGCGCHIIFDPRKKLIKVTGESKVYRHYRCTNGKGKHTDTKGLRVHEDSLFAQFGLVLDQITIPPEIVSVLTKKLNEQAITRKNQVSDEIKRIHALIKNVEQTSFDLYNDFKSGLLDEETYRSFVSRNKNEKDELQIKLNELESFDHQNEHETLESTLQLAKDAKSLWEKQSPHKKVELLDKLLSNPRLNGVNIEYDLKFQFKVLLEKARN